MRNLSTLLLALMVSIGVTGCDDSVPNPKKNDSSFGSSYDYRIVVIEQCEYIYMGAFNSQTITHKGNCKNSIHKK